MYLRIKLTLFGKRYSILKEKESNYNFDNFFLLTPQVLFDNAAM